MTIRKGEDWGARRSLPPEGVVAGGDAEARQLIEECRRAGRAIPPIGLTGGDLWKALGAPSGGAARLRGDDARTLPMDLGHVVIDGRPAWFLCHLVARRSWWLGRVVAVMNTEWLGEWRVVPRAHPNDGMLELVDGDPSLGQRWLARRRLRTGDHLPHPDLALRRVRRTELRFDRPTDVYLDGVRAGRACVLEVSIEPDALSVVV
jgi:hypothetical protein